MSPETLKQAKAAIAALSLTLIYRPNDQSDIKASLDLGNAAEHALDEALSAATPAGPSERALIEAVGNYIDHLETDPGEDRPDKEARAKWLDYYHDKIIAAYKALPSADGKDGE